MTYCYLCSKEWTGYYGDYFCAECEKLRKVVMCIGAKKITDNIRFNPKKIELTDMSETGEPTYNLRSREKII